MVATGFVKIDVRVKRPDVTVRARRGFLPPDPKAATKAHEVEAKAGTSPALRAALNRPVPIGDLPFRVFAAPFRAAGSNGSVLLAIEIEGAALRFREADGRFNEKVEVSIVAADERARVRGEDRQEFDMKLQPETYQRVRRTGIRMLSRLTLPPGRYQIHVGAYETTGGATGTVPYDLEVPDSAKAGFGLSGIVLTSSRADLLVTANPDPVLKDALPGSPDCDSAVQHERDLECVRRGVRRTAPGWWNRARHACARCRRWTRGFRVERLPRQESRGPSQRIPCGCPVERLVARPLCAGGGGHRGRGCIRATQHTFRRHEPMTCVQALRSSSAPSY